MYRRLTSYQTPAPFQREVSTAVAVATVPNKGPRLKRPDIPGPRNPRWSDFSGRSMAPLEQLHHSVVKCLLGSVKPNSLVRDVYFVVPCGNETRRAARKGDLPFTIPL